MTLKRKKSPKPKPYVPNHISKLERTLSLIFSFALLLYGAMGLIYDNIYIPGKYREGIHFHGLPAWLLFSAIFCAIVNISSVVVDHYDKRNNEINYQKFAKRTRVTGWTLFIVATILDLYLYY